VKVKTMDEALFEFELTKTQKVSDLKKMIEEVKNSKAKKTENSFRKWKFH
jgi:hypothetical protein